MLFVPHPSILTTQSSILVSRRGFTLLELMIAVAIFAVIAVVAILSWSGYQRTQGLEATSQGLADLLREAQGNALNRVSDIAWCVRVTNVAGSSSSYAELYASSDCSGASQRRVMFPSTVEFSDPADGQAKIIAFAERSGRRIGGTPAGAVSWGYGPSFDLVRIARYVGTGGTGCVGGSGVWRCETVGSPGLLGSAYPGVAFDASGDPRVVFTDFLNGVLFARRVGIGGTGCGSTDVAWSCEVVESAGNSFGVLAFSPAGQAWLTYQYNSSSALKIAREVGSGGTGCASPAWTCVTIDDPVNDVAGSPSLAFDFSGLAWIAHRDDTAASIKVARETSGTPALGGCAAGWTCETLIDDAVAQYFQPSIAIDAAGVPWVGYNDNSSSSNLKIARYVGSGGTGCTSSAWTCTTVDDPVNGVAQYLSLSFDSGGTAWIAYNDTTAGAFKIARYVGSGGTGCGGSTAWTCTTVDDPVNTVAGRGVDIDMDFGGNPWIAYNDTPGNALKIARYTPGLGAGCAPVSPDWSCEVVEAQDDGGWNPSIARSPFEEIAFFLAANPTSVRILRVGEEGGIVIE